MRHQRFVFGYFFFVILFSESIKVNGQKTPDSLPEFSFPGLNEELVRSSSFDNGRSLILFYFDPTCSHCEKQAEWVSEAMEQFQTVDLFWLAWEENETIPDFKEKYFPLDENVFFAKDVDYSFDSLFGFSQIPSVFVFDGNNNLLKKFKNETKVEKLLRVLDN